MKSSNGVVLSRSSSCKSSFNSMLSTNSLDLRQNFSRLMGFFGFIFALGTSAPNGTSSSSFPTSTSSARASIGSMSLPVGARSVFRVFVGLTSALLCHTRFLAAETCSQYWFLLTSLLCSSRNGRYCRCRLE